MAKFFFSELLHFSLATQRKSIKMQHKLKFMFVWSMELFCIKYANFSAKNDVPLSL